MAGIICIETEFQITKRNNRLSTNSEHLMRFLSEELGIDYIYRRVATYAEFLYYMGQFSKKSYAKYNIVYFSFHGDTHSIYFEGDGKSITLDELGEQCPDCFADRFVHFGSCRTMLGAEETVRRFLSNTKAKVVSGYTKSVDSSLCAIHDTALIKEYVTRKQIPPIFKSLQELYGGLESKLGFKHFE